MRISFAAAAKASQDAQTIVSPTANREPTGSYKVIFIYGLVGARKITSNKNPTPATLYPTCILI